MALRVPGSDVWGSAIPVDIAVTSVPSPRLADERYGKPLTHREAEALMTYARVGNTAAAAQRTGCSLQTFKNFLSTAYAKLGADGALQSFVLLGWLRVPDPAELAFVLDRRAALDAVRQARDAADHYIAELRGSQ